MAPPHSCTTQSDNIKEGLVGSDESVHNCRNFLKYLVFQCKSFLSKTFISKAVETDISHSTLAHPQMSRSGGSNCALIYFDARLNLFPADLMTGKGRDA